VVAIRKLTRTAAAASAATLAVALLSTTPALASSGHRHGHDVIRAGLVGSMPAPASPAIANIQPGGAPWVNGPSFVRVRDNGRIDVRIHGLVIPPPVGTGVNPVLSAVATLVCGDPAVVPVNQSTKPFALSTAGNGSTRDHITVPKRCHDAVVLIQPAGNRAVYIASTVDEEGDD
jgi:hypothetical protein